MLSEIELKKIEEICFRLRNAIINGEIKFIGSEDFPHGCCGNASQDWLIHWLVDAGFIEIVYENGSSEKYPFHGWLEYRGYIIDITADQFPEITEPVLIIKKEASEFHKQFEIC